MIDPEIRTRIRSLFFSEHWKVGTIVTALGVHPDTVKSAIDTERMRNAHNRLCHSLLDPFRPFIAETLEAYPRLRATRILEMLVERGYQGRYGIVRDHVRATRKQTHHEAFLRLRTLPGEQAPLCQGSCRLGSASA